MRLVQKTISKIIFKGDKIGWNLEQKIPQQVFHLACLYAHNAFGFSHTLWPFIYCEEPTLWKWNVIMYANVTLPLTLVSNKLNVHFFSVLFQWENLGAHFESSCRKREQKLRRKMPGCFAVECQHHSMRNPCQIFRFPIADSQLKR